MTLYLSNRDGNGKTSEEGHYKFQTSVFTGNVLGATALQVTQNSPLGMSVIVLPGQYRVDTGSDYSYTGWNSANAPVSISPADVANPRITSIVLYIDKSAPTAPSPPNNPGVAKLIAVNGSPGAIPVPPNSTIIQSAVGTGNPYIVLANVTVGTSATQITNANISDQRIQVSLGANIVTAASIFDGSVSTDELANLSVTSAKLATNAVTTTKVADGAVTDAKWRNNVAFYAYRLGVRTFAASTFTLIAADTTVWNYGGGYSNASNAGRFTAPVKGIYSFTANLMTEISFQTRAIIEIRKNGAGSRQFDNTSTRVARANATAVYDLNVGDYVEAWGWMNASSNVSGVDTWFEGHLITRT